jgi:hypothetical protein
MEPSSSIFISGPLAARRAADLQLAWIDAADDVQDAYLAWHRVERAERDNAFTAYQAALDREEAAGDAIARCQWPAQIKLSLRARDMASDRSATPSLRWMLRVCVLIAESFAAAGGSAASRRSGETSSVAL